MRTDREPYFIAAFILIAAFGVVGNLDYAAALEMEAEEKLALPLRASNLSNHPLPANLAACRRGGIPGTVLSVNATADGVHLWRRTCLEPRS